MKISSKSFHSGNTDASRRFEGGPGCGFFVVSFSSLGLTQVSAKNHKLTLLQRKICSEISRKCFHVWKNKHLGSSCPLDTSEYNRLEQNFVLGLVKVASSCLLLNISFGNKSRITFRASEYEGWMWMRYIPVWLKQPKLVFF